MIVSLFIVVVFIMVLYIVVNPFQNVLILGFESFGLISANVFILSNEPQHEKTCLRGLRPGKTQTGRLSFRD